MLMHNGSAIRSVQEVDEESEKGITKEEDEDRDGEDAS